MEPEPQEVKTEEELRNELARVSFGGHSLSLSDDDFGCYRQRKKFKPSGKFLPLKFDMPQN